MKRSKSITSLAGAAVVPLTALAVVGCGGGGAAATAASHPPSAPAHAKVASKQTTVVGVRHTSLGRILVNAQGRTLYLFKADVGKNSACSGACAVAWPPLLATGKPTAGAGLTASKLGTISRAGGKRQVTYNGHPLYLFVMDQKPGDVTGEGVVAFGAAWFIVSPAGRQISSKASARGGSASSSPPAPAAPSAPKPQPAPNPQPAPKPAPKPKPAATTPAPPATTPAPPATTPAPPATTPAPPATPPGTSGIPQNNGGDGDADNNGGPSDGDGNI